MRLVWDTGRITLLGFSDGALVESPVCEAVGEGCSWSPLSTTGHTVEAEPSERAQWTEWLRLRFFHEDDPSETLSSAYQEGGSVVGGDPIFYKARFRLREGIDMDRPSYVWLTDERFSLDNGLTLSAAPQTIGGARHVVVSEGWVGDPDLTASPSSHDFGTIESGEQADQEFVVTNTGDSDLSIRSLFLIGRDPHEFSVAVDGCAGQVLVSGESCSATLRFAPVDADAKQATLVIHSDDADAPQLWFALSGTSIGSAAPSNQPPTARINLSAASGSAPLNLFADAFASSDEDGVIVDYQWVVNGGQNAVGPSASLTFTEAGRYAITLTVTDDGGASATASEAVTVTGGEAGDEATACIQVITWGLDPRTGAWREFPTPCDVPAGWESSSSDPTGTTGGVPLNDGTLSANGVSGSVTLALGDSLEVRYAMVDFDPSGTLDLYIALAMPGGAMLFLEPSGGLFGEPGFSLLPTPYLANSSVTNQEGTVFSLPALPPTLPAGVYAFHAVPVLSGANPLDRGNWMGELSSVRVNVAR